MHLAGASYAHAHFPLQDFFSCSAVQHILQCPSCRTRYLNLAPEKLQIGASLLVRPQQPPLQQQQLSTSSDLAAASALRHGGHSFKTHTATAFEPRRPSGLNSSKKGVSPSEADVAVEEYWSSIHPASSTLKQPVTEDPKPASASFRPSLPSDSKILHRSNAVVNASDVMEVVSAATGIPVERLALGSHVSSLAHLDLAGAVVGQEEAIKVGGLCGGLHWGLALVGL